jgi:hypothetical protein
MTLRAKVGAATAVAAVGLAGIAAGVADAAVAQSGAAKSRLKTFESCQGLIDYANAHARRTGFRWAPRIPVDAPLPPPRPVPLPTLGPDGAEQRTGEVPAAAPAPQPGESGGAVTQDFSTTNVQEAGVDEADIIKTDGNRIFAVAGQKLHIIDARAAEPTLVASLDIQGSDPELLLHGRTKGLLISRITLPYGASSSRARSAVAPLPPGRQQVRFAELDLTNAVRPKVVRTYVVDGSYVTSRLSGATARVVISSPPQALTGPAATPALRRQLKGWLPQARLAGAAPSRRWFAAHRRATKPRQGRRQGTRRRAVRRRGSRHGGNAAARVGATTSVVPCRQVRRPAQFSGLGTVTILTIDMAAGLPAVDADAVLSDVDTVYAAVGSLYVATQRYAGPPRKPNQPPPQITSAIHRFVAGDGATEYRSSGLVPGSVLNQFALSEHAGHLRVASTDNPLWWPGGDRPQSQSFVTVLRENGANLVQVGQVGGLGRGERIFGVRFIGDAAYVVTFRQTDPLYTVDLSNPAAPALKGELKVLGYSAYLHPVGDDLLLGVGQDATETGDELGTQLSLFDVRDLSNPTRLAQVTIGDGTSVAEFDHRAFLYWAPARLAVVPFRRYALRGSSFDGAVGFQVGRDVGIREVGRIEHSGNARSDRAIQRSTVLGPKLFTLSALGLEASDLTTLRELSFLRFPDPSPSPPGPVPPVPLEDVAR